MAELDKPASQLDIEALKQWKRVLLDEVSANEYDHRKALALVLDSLPPIIAVLEDRERLVPVLVAAREMSALDIDYLMRNREAAFAAADKLQDVLDVYDRAALEGRDG